MIRKLAGQVAAQEAQAVILALGEGRGLWVEVNVPDPAAAELAVGERVSLYTHLYVRAEELSLYGFLRPEEYRFFRQLLRVNGVGPRAACGLLGAMAPAALAQAILHNEPKVITRAPGIGKRTAQKIIMELADRLADLDADYAGMPSAVQADEEVLQALTQMGFSQAEAQQALRNVPADITDEGERIRLALRQLG